MQSYWMTSVAALGRALAAPLAEDDRDGDVSLAFEQAPATTTTNAARMTIRPY